jgi:hypothetical protein
MSGFHDVVVEPAIPALVPIAIPILGTVTSLAALGVGGAVYAAYIAIQKLNDDYKSALCELQTRADTEAQVRALEGAAHQSADVAVRAMARRTMTAEDANATVEFLLDRLTRLADRLGALPDTDPTLPAECARLHAALTEPVEDLAAYVAEYVQLADAVAEVVAAHAPAAAGALAAEVAALREELQAPVFAGADFATERIRLLQQLDALANMATRNPDVAVQGMTLLRERVRRELREQTTARQQRAASAAELRALVSDALAKLQALITQQELPEMRLQAEALLSELAAVLAGASDPRDRLQALTDTATALFDDCRRALEERAVSAYVSEQVRDVLLSLGYQVSMVPADTADEAPALVVPVDQRVGVSFHTDAAGHMKTAVVSFDADHPEADAQTKPKACALVEQVLTTLREREWHVREKYRITVKAGERLKVVSLPKADAQAAAAAPQYMKVDPE